MVSVLQKLQHFRIGLLISFAFKYFTVQLEGFFNFPPIPVGRLICPLQSHSRLHLHITCNFMIFTLWPPCNPPCVSTQMGGITGGYKILILSTQVKQGKVHRILITPLQSHSKLHWKIPVFSLQSFHRNGWNHRGVIFFNPSTQFYYLLGLEGNWEKTLELYCRWHFPFWYLIYIPEFI